MFKKTGFVPQFSLPLQPALKAKDLNQDKLLKRFDKGPPVGNASKCKTKTGKMPKVKTNSSAKKRFKVTATGKIMHQKSFKRHILTKKSKKRKRNLRMDGEVAKSHMDFVRRLLRLK